MAQVLYYHRWPQSVAAQPAYTDDKKQTVEALKATTLKWDKMLDSYQGNTATEEQQQAVAELMRYCGQAMKMDYTLTFSGAVMAATQLTDYFGYGKNTHMVLRSHYTTGE